MALTNLGIFHTIIGVMAIIGAILSYSSYGRINLDKKSGLIYFYGTVITSLTALGISKHGGFNPGHVFALFIVLLVAVAYYLHRKKPGNNKARYFENFAMAFSLFLSMIPTINETLTRIPVSHPLAKDVKDPLIIRSLFATLAVFIAGAIYQVIKQRKINNQAVPQ
jgi:uncharacterized membrane protein YfcA